MFDLNNQTNLNLCHRVYNHTMCEKSYELVDTDNRDTVLLRGSLEACMERWVHIDDHWETDYPELEGHDLTLVGPGDFIMYRVSGVWGSSRDVLELGLAATE
jgi:hypothetical protein